MVFFVKIRSPCSSFSISPSSVQHTFTAYHLASKILPSIAKFYKYQNSSFYSSLKGSEETVHRDFQQLVTNILMESVQKFFRRPCFCSSKPAHFRGDWTQCLPQARSEWFPLYHNVLSAQVSHQKYGARWFFPVYISDLLWCQALPTLWKFSMPQPPSPWRFKFAEQTVLLGATISSEMVSLLK